MFDVTGLTPHEASSEKEANMEGILSSTLEITSGERKEIKMDSAQREGGL